MAHRLQTVDAALFAILSSADDAARRRVRIAIAGWVAQLAKLSAEPVLIGLAALADDEVVSDVVRSDIRRLADELDEAAWDKQDLVDAGTSTDAEYVAAFRSARAATAVLFALDDVDADAAADTCYEAQAAVDNMTEVRAIALTQLDG